MTRLEAIFVPNNILYCHILDREETIGNDKSFGLDAFE